ncbi:hypothetical protein N0V95_008504 [Ascochyta clinopodiicola]|nr:hypothetical protein N0V95_008504 [Ascochyta clinopodiicola]
MKLLHKDLKNRLSFDWVVPNKPAAYRVALVAGRHLYDGERVTYRAQGFLEAAKALGMAVTVLDESGHWLEGERYAHLRSDFIAVDVSTSQGLPQRIVETVRGRDIDGIITFTDELLIDVAEAAEILGMPTEPAKAVWRTHHKQEMRRIVENTNVQAMALDGPGKLDDPATSKKLEALRYPLIIKPAYGRASAGVRKVADNAEMHEAIRLLEEEGLAEDGIVIETFVDGPELDCNFVLRDGKILFFEATDDLPSAGDASDATVTDNFFETAMISNSGLPLEELEILRSSLHRSLLHLGLSWGVFHVEARIQDSSMRYQNTKGDVITDLVSKNTIGDGTTVSGHQPSAFMVEANVRPPGIGGSWVTLYTYGVDFYALHLLRAVGDRERFDSLSHPFIFSPSAGGGGGAQYWAAHCLIPVHRENIRVPDGFFEKLYRIVPEVVLHTAMAEMHVKPGTVISPHGGVGLFAYCVLFTRISRRHMLELCRSVADAAKKVLDS